MLLYIKAKGQTKPKADWRTKDFPKRRTNKFIFLPWQSGNTIKLEILIANFKYFQSVKQKNQIGSFGFWENLQRANLLMVLFDLYLVLFYKQYFFKLQLCAKLDVYFVYCNNRYSSPQDL